jgi:hypothetical protein
VSPRPCIGRDHVTRPRVDLCRLAQLAHAESVSEYDVAVLVDAYRYAGTLVSFIAVSTKRASSAIRTVSSGFAFLPAKDSRW